MDINPSIIVSVDHSIQNVADVIRNEPESVAIVSDESNRLIGTVTDGDIRSAILSGLSLTSPVKYCMQGSPNFDLIDGSSDYHQSVMCEFGLSHLILLDKSQKIAGIALLEDSMLDPSEHSVFILAGGLGSRLRPITELCPKPMIELAGKPILERIIERFSAHGFRKFILSVNYMSEKISDYFEDGSRFGVHIDYVHEKKKLGTAGSLSLLNNLPEKPLFVTNADVVSDIDYRAMMEFHLRAESDASVAVNQYSEQIQYGVLTITAGKVQRFEEKPLIKFSANSGIYILNPSVIKRVEVDQRVDMPTLLSDVIDSQGNIAAFPLHEYWIDIGMPKELERAEKEILDFENKKS